ncbi:MAG TPA: MlaD family protein [Draconibacterium sp.]|nr:MlaD family protein [Draconibacterium sp.]
MRISKYTKLGILIVLSLTILIWGLAYLKGNDFFSRSQHYYVFYDRIDGLEESSNVSLNGYPIGKVRHVEFTSDNSGRLMVTLAINDGFKIPKKSVAQIVSSDIMGTRSVKLLLSHEKEMYQPNDTLVGAIESDLKEQVSMQVLPLKNKAEELLGTLDSAITVFTMIFNEDAQKNLTASIANVNRTIKNLESTTGDLKDIVSSEKENVKNIVNNLDDITTTFKNNSQQLDATIKNLHAFSDTISNVSVTPIVNNIEAISEKLSVTLDKLNSSESTAGLLLNDDELYNSLNMLSENMAFLINDIKNNPKRYLQFSAFDFGKEVYVNTKNDLSNNDIIFKIHLISSRTKISLNNGIFKNLHNVEEYYSGGIYSYLMGDTGVYAEIEELHNSIRKDFPESSIVAFKNGKLIKLEKALKSTH